MRKYVQLSGVFCLFTFRYSVVLQGVSSYAVLAGLCKLTCALKLNVGDDETLSYQVHYLR